MTISDFSNLASLNVGGTRDYDLPYGLGVLRVASATEDNRPYFNDGLKRHQGNRGRSRMLAAGKVTARMRDEMREEDKDAYAKFIVLGWSGVKDAAGNDAPFSVDNVRAFLKALPNHIFDDLTTFCGNPANFVEAMEAEGVAKNLPSG